MKKRKYEDLRTILNILALMALFFVQATYLISHIPETIRWALWTIYLLQSLVLSCRLFGIKVKSLYEMMGVFVDIVKSKFFKG